jgi:hypothetical protein
LKKHRMVDIVIGHRSFVTSVTAPIIGESSVGAQRLWTIWRTKCSTGMKWTPPEISEVGMMGTKWNKLWGRTRLDHSRGCPKCKEPVDIWWIPPSHLEALGSTKHQVYSATGRLINIYQSCESWVEDGWG